MNFDIDKKQRKSILKTVLEKIENYYLKTKDFRTAPDLNIEKIREYINSTNLTEGHKPDEALNHVIKGLEDYSVHTPHPKYFGLFNPRSNFAGIIADLITASYNPQLAAWSHAPFAVEVEAKVIREFTSKFGYDSNKADGVYTTGGTEANLTAVLCALNHKYPKFAEEGLFGVSKKPLIYCSEEAHHSIQKAAKIVGLGYDSVKSIPITENLKLDTSILERDLNELEKLSYAPLMVIGTAGTTGTGTIDDLYKINEICKKFSIWFHVDAAYGGASVLSEKLKHLLKGVEYSDSITFDAHKWMSVPMGTSVFLTSHNEILGKTFRIATEYMPKEAKEMDIVEPFTHSIQWSRRFNGLKVYLSLLFYGWKGFEQTINHQARMGNLLRRKLTDNSWIIKNKTGLPVVCFTDERFETDSNFTQLILDKIIAKGKSWLSVYPIQGVPTFRTCITNYNTTENEIDELVEELNEERELFRK
jgi:aromatic-L-amino-acid/L-tryptophan decarboxylase